MKITHDVLKDLLPAYLSGEASSDTHNLIEEFERSDAQFARLLEAERQGLEKQRALLKGGQPSLPPDHELQTLVRAKVQLERRSWLMAIALMFTAFPCSVVFDGGKITFLVMRDQPWLAALCWCLAVALWTMYFALRKRLRSTGL